MTAKKQSKLFDQLLLECAINNFKEGRASGYKQGFKQGYKLAELETMQDVEKLIDKLQFHNGWEDYGDNSPMGFLGDCIEVDKLKQSFFQLHNPQGSLIREAGSQPEEGAILSDVDSQAGKQDKSDSPPVCPAPRWEKEKQ